MQACSMAQHIFHHYLSFLFSVFDFKLAFSLFTEKMGRPPKPKVAKTWRDRKNENKRTSRNQTACGRRSKFRRLKDVVKFYRVPGKAGIQMKCLLCRQSWGKVASRMVNHLLAVPLLLFTRKFTELVKLELVCLN